jgi:hypothetical protein
VVRGVSVRSVCIDVDAVSKVTEVVVEPTCPVIDTTFSIGVVALNAAPNVTVAIAVFWDQ